MLRIALFVFIGGGIGALVRELLMLGVRVGYDGFPLDIFVANVVGSLVLGITAGMHSRMRVGDFGNALIGTGFCGGLTTFSSFVYASVVLMAASSREAAVATIYVFASMIIGYAAVRIGQRIGAAGARAS